MAQELANSKISLFGAVSTGVGMIIATSCFIPLAEGASRIGTPFAFAIAMVCLLNMMAISSIAEMNAIMPNLTGGLAQFMLVGFGPMLTIVIMTGGYIVSNVFASPAEGVMFANVMKEFTGWNVPPAVFSVTLTVILVLINFRGVEFSTAVQSVIAVFMVISLFALGLIGAIGAGTGRIVHQPHILLHSWKEIFPTMSSAFWLFIGAEFIIPMGKDMRKPKKNVPRAMFLSLAIMCVIQILMVFGFANYTPWAQLRASNSPHTFYAVNLLGRFGRYWIIAASLMAAISTQNAIISSVSEVCCGMARSGLLPKALAKKNRWNAPYLIILIMGAATILIEATNISSGSAVQFLILTSSVFWMLTYIAFHIDTIVLRVRMKSVPRVYKSHLFPLPQIIGIIGTAYMIAHISNIPSERNKILGLTAIIFVLLIVYALLWTKYKMKISPVRHFRVRDITSMENPLYGKEK